MELVEILWGAATRLFSCSKAHAAYVYNLEENLVSLQRKWDHLQRISMDVRRRIEDAEVMGEMERTSEVNGWLEEVENLQKVMEDIQAQVSQEIHNKCLSGCCPKNCVSSYKLGRRVVKMLSDVDELFTQKECFGKTVDITYKPPFKLVDEMPSIETVGLDSMLQEVWNSLEDENMGIIGLYGMGGVGKTTLLKKINNEFVKKRHDFSVVLWVKVPRDCDIQKVMNDIRNRLGIKDDIWNGSSQDQRAAKIYQVLKQKKFVLMLDDLWGNLELEMVGVPFPKNTKYQSKVLFTTRSQDVCDKMKAQKSFKVECLSKEEAFDLFCTKVGEDTLKYHEEIRKLAWEMAQECGGLPLALITMGSAMAGVKSVTMWSQAKSHLSNFPLTGPDLEEKVYSILRFSYDRLPNETHKRCFLYCALYPEDYAITFDELIDRWIGEGFLGKDQIKKSIYDMYEEGESIIEKLKLTCLLEGAETKIITFWRTVKMHDVIRDMGLWLARDQDGKKDKVVVQGEALAMSEMNFERLNIVERISIRGVNGSWQVPACSNLFTLSVGQSVDIIDFSNLQSMRRLKVLDLSISIHERDEIVQLPPEIGKLVNLEFLNLSGRELRNRLPIELKNLENLKIFLMEYVFVENYQEIIPIEVIAGLERLKVFRFSLKFNRHVNFSTEAAFLEKLESLPELEELGMEIGTISGLQKLLESTKLLDCSRKIRFYSINDPLEMSSLLASLSRMKHLDRISLSHMYNIMGCSFITDTCHLHKLRWVHIEFCNSITHLTWLRYAPLVESLFVSTCELIEEVVKGPEDEDGGINRDNTNDIFSNLRRLFLIDLPKLKSIHGRALAFPFLKVIRVYECPNLRKLPFNANSAKESLIAIKGSTVWWNNLEWEDTNIKIQLQSKLEPPCSNYG